jgi:hypothetical protein
MPERHTHQALQQARKQVYPAATPRALQQHVLCCNTGHWAAARCMQHVRTHDCASRRPLVRLPPPPSLSIAIACTVLHRSGTRCNTVPHCLPLRGSAAYDMQLVRGWRAAAAAGDRPMCLHCRGRSRHGPLAFARRDARLRCNVVLRRNVWCHAATCRAALQRAVVGCNASRCIATCGVTLHCGAQRAACCVRCNVSCCAATGAVEPCSSTTARRNVFFSCVPCPPQSKRGAILHSAAQVRVRLRGLARRAVVCAAAAAGDDLVRHALRRSA